MNKKQDEAKVTAKNINSVEEAIFDKFSKETHKVIDLIYEGQDDEIDAEVFSGTYKQCHNFIVEQSNTEKNFPNLYKIVPII